MKDNFLYTAANLYSVVLTFLFTILVRNIISEEIIGVFVFANSLVLLMDAPRKILSFSIERLLPKYMATKDKNYTDAFSNSVFNLLMVINVVLGVLFALCGTFIFNDSLHQTYAFYVVSITFSIEAIITFFFMYFKSLNELRKSSMVLIIKTTLTNVVLFGVSYFFKDEGYFFALLAGSFSALGAVVLYLFIHRKMIALRVNVKAIDFKIIKEVWKLGIALSVASLITNFLMNIDKYYLKHISVTDALVSDKTLAYYGFAVQGIMAVTNILKSFMGSFTTKLYTNHDTQESSDHIIREVSLINLITAFAMASAIYLSIDFVIPLVFPGKTGWLECIPYFQILAIGIIPTSQYNVAYILSVAEHKLANINIISLVLVAVTIGLNHFFFGWLGLNGVPWATIAMTTLLYLVMAYNVKHSFRYWYFGIIALALFIVISIYFKWLLLAALPVGVYFYFHLKKKLKAA